MAKHKWSDVIIAYANGETIQYLNLDEPDGKWQDWDKSCVSHIFFCETSPNFESKNYKFRVKPKNDYSEIVEKVLNEVDCETIHKVMVATNHKWYSYIEDDYVVPCISTIRNKVRKLVVTLIAENLSETSTNGLTVKWYRPVGGCFRDTIQVKFQPVVDVFIPIEK